MLVENLESNFIHSSILIKIKMFLLSFFANTSFAILYLISLSTAAAGKPNKPVPAGQSSLAYSQDHKGNYQFAYEISDKVGASNFRQENSNGKVVRGSYGLTDVDGRTRLVNYQADKHGFVAAVDTNEPGTSREDAASAIYNGPDKGKGWAYAVSLQDQGKPTKNGKKSSYSIAPSSQSSESDDDRYSSAENESYARDEYSPAPSRTTSNNPRVNKESSTSTSSASASTVPSLMDVPLVGPAMHSSVSGAGGQSSLADSGASIQSNPDVDTDVGLNDSVSNDFADEKISPGQYTDNDRTLLDDDGPTDDSVQTNEYEYKKREFSSKKPPVTSPSYSQTVHRLAQEQLYPAKSIFQSHNKYPIRSHHPLSLTPPPMHSDPSLSTPIVSRSSASNYGYASRHVPVIRPSKPSLRSVFFWK